MIDLARAALHAEGVTIFPDHADPRRFHYLPDSPRLRLRADGSPELHLTKYRLDPALHESLGAGLLALTVDLAVDEERLALLRARISRHFEGVERPVLTPVVADSGTVELALIDASSEQPGGAGLIERILGAATPSLYGDNSATFLVVLSAEGASLVEAALRGDGLPAGVVYQLHALALRPALRARVTARWQDVYHFYEDRLHGGQLLAAVDIGPTIEALVRAEALHIEIDELVPAAERAEVLDRVIARVQDWVLETLFKPTLGQAPPQPDDEGGLLATVGRAVKDILGVVTFTYSLRSVDRAELKTLTYQLSAARAERLTLAPQGTFPVMMRALGAAQSAGLVSELEPAAADELHFDIGAAADLAAEEIDHLEVSVHHGDREAVLLLDPLAPRQEFVAWYRPEFGLALRYSYSVHFRAGDAGSVTTLRSDERTTEARVVRIDPRELYQRPGIDVVAQGVPFDRWPLVLVDLRAVVAEEQGAALVTLELAAGRAEASHHLRLERDAAVRFQRRLRYVDVHGRESVVDWEQVEPGVLVVGDPFPEVLDVQILGSARFGSEVARIVVELRPAAEPGQVTTRVLSREAPVASWSLPLADPSQRAYEYRVTVYTTRGEVREGSWLPGEGAKLVVGEGIARLRDVELLLVGRTPAELGLLGLKVRFAFEDPESGLFAEDERLVEDPKKPIQWTYPVASAARQAYTYALTLIHADGTIERREPILTSDLLIVHPLR